MSTVSFPQFLFSVFEWLFALSVLSILAKSSKTGAAALTASRKLQSLIKYSDYVSF